MRACQLLLVVTLAGAVHAQGTRDELVAKVKQVVTAIQSAPAGSPATAGLLQADGGARFLRDLHLEWKTFENRDGTAALGFGWSFDKVVDLKYFQSGTTTRGFGLQLSAKGNVAFTEDSNPQDFLESRLGIRFFQNSGGLVRTGAEPEGDERPLDAEGRTWIKRWDDVIVRQATLQPGQEKEMEQANRDLFAFAEDLDTQVYFDVALDGGLESDQQFTARNSVFGVRGILDVKAWNPDSGLAWANVFDYPFGVIRYLLATDTDFQPRGASIPTLLAGIDWVEPQGDDPRALAGDRTGFLRVRGELGFRTPIGNLGGRDVHLACTYRIFHELDATAAIEAADLGTYDYFAASLVADGGLFVSYRTGRLPFDQADDEAFELGFKMHF